VQHPRRRSARARHDADVQQSRDPAALFPGYSYGTTVQMPAIPFPEADADLARWLATDAAAAQPWLPTVAEQDARWWECFGERVENMRAGRRTATAIGAMA
jgi:hypothetical protein